MSQQAPQPLDDGAINHPTVDRFRGVDTNPDAASCAVAIEKIRDRPARIGLLNRGDCILQVAAHQVGRTVSRPFHPIEAGSREKQRTSGEKSSAIFSHPSREGICYAF